MGCGARMTRLRHFPCCCGGLRWMVTCDFCGYGITEDLCREAAGVGGDAARPGEKMVDRPDVVYLVDAKAVVAFEKWFPTSLCVRQRRTRYDGQRDVTGRAGLIVSCTASAHAVQLEM